MIGLLAATDQNRQYLGMGLLKRLGSQRVLVELVKVALEGELVFGPDASEAADELCRRYGSAHVRK
jgi:hypothetical protein